MRLHRRTCILALIGWAVSGLYPLWPQGAEGASSAIEPSEESKWYGVFGGGWVDFEGAQDYKDGAAVCLFLGYDLNERWALEAGIHWAPVLERNKEEAPGLTWDSASQFAASLDGVFHFTRWKRVDPYLAAGLGYSHYTQEPLSGSKTDFLLRGGGGVFLHWNDEWAVRADFRSMLVGFGKAPHANSVISAGIVWHWGARIPPKYIAEAGSDDWDRDGLKNDEERKLGTNPYNPDTDGDGLSDGEEVLRYMTNPLETDTDLDLLTDGDEVKKYKTDPLNPDTDGGGVRDGHELLEDQTDPLNPHDDLVLYELNIEFDLDKADLKPRYFPQLDVIGKVLTRNPGSTARIEGHCDRLWKSEKRYNDNLSHKRAQAVMDYLIRVHKIDPKRLTAFGYGFSRPKVPNDLRNPAGTPANRRVEIYIRKAPRTDALMLPTGEEAVIHPVPRREPPDAPSPPVSQTPRDVHPEGEGHPPLPPAAPPRAEEESRPEDK